MVITLRNICKNTGFVGPVFFHRKTKLKLPHGTIQVRGNLCSGIFYAVQDIILSADVRAENFEKRRCDSKAVAKNSILPQWSFQTIIKQGKNDSELSVFSEQHGYRKALDFLR